jgi:hypothetical protein
MKKIIFLITTLLTMSIIFTGCNTENTETQISAQQDKIIKEASNQVGLPNIKEFYEKKMAKEIFELRDNSKLICYAYTKNEMTGKYVYEGQCMGYGLPYSTQYTNPEQIIKFNESYAYAGDAPQTMPQADPNGLYMPNSASATWLMMINEETGKKEIEYYEPNLVVTQNKKPKRLCEEWSLPKDY